MRLAFTKVHPRRGMTVIELAFASAIFITVSIPVLAAMMFVLRTQATASDVTLTRLQAESVVWQIRADIRNSSSGAYNTVGWPRLLETESAISWTLLDTVGGSRIRWTFEKGSNLLHRDVGTVVDDSMANTRTTYPVVFVDFRAREIQHTEFAALVGAGGEVDVEDESSSQTQVTAIGITGRVFHRLGHHLTVWREVDGNGDGSFADDQLGADLFDRENEGDDPRWQYLFNSQIGFRNS